MPKFLRAFLSRLGCNDIPIYDSLDGRYLVPFQAAVCRKDWERAWSILEAPFRVQRSHYRKSLGVKQAPELDLTVKPKFRPFLEANAPQEENLDASSVTLRFSIQRTFLHCAESDSVSAPPRPRAGSGSLCM